MGYDPTEEFRRGRQAELNGEAAEREALEAKYGQVWSTSELVRDFEVIGFGAPYCIVRRLSDKRKGSLEFQHSPRFYFNFQPS